MADRTESATDPEKRTCRACGGTLGPVFFDARNVPVHSCLMLDNAADSAAFPKGDVRLATCSSCGCVFNLDFDRHWSAYSPSYEDQQAFSPTFNAFSGRLAADLVQRHDLHGQCVVDIGCSKGDFLAQLCEAGAALGTGIDPSAIPERAPVPTRGRLQFECDYYREAHTRLPAQLITCRHTLEHIHDVAETLRRIRRHAVHAGGAPVFIEVPNLQHILDHHAFEDIYYEHCSYFTPGSLARALRKAGFGVRRIWTDYDDQYLLAEASVDPAEDCTAAIEEPVDDLQASIHRFETAVHEQIAQWKQFTERVLATGMTAAIWGSGSKCIAFWHAVATPSAFSTIVDINPHRWGRFPPSLPLPIAPSAALSQRIPNFVIIMNEIYRSEIEQELASLGVTARVLSLRDPIAKIVDSLDAE